MTRSSDRIYQEGLELFSSVVDRYPADDWDRPSPCAGWRALDVLGHVGATTRFGIDLLSDAAPVWQPSQQPGALVEGDPRTWWHQLAERARALVSQVDVSRVVETPFGRRSVAEGLSFPAIDLFVHAWDLGASGGIGVDIPPEAVEFTHAVLDGLPVEQVRSPNVFAAEQPAPVDATPTEAFIAWTGRDPRWRGG